MVDIDLVVLGAPFWRNAFPFTSKLANRKGKAKGPASYVRNFQDYSVES